ncbi:MAG: pheS, partial [Segetibacter sp.]|nr:pheS [Segetibacter sp.]
MEKLLQQIESYKQEIGSYNATTPEEVENFRIKYLGTKGLVKAVMGEMKNVPGDQRKEFGLILNAFKIFAEERYESLKNNTSNSEQESAANYDWSLPADPVTVGTRHPLSIVRNQIVSI